MGLLYGLRPVAKVNSSSPTRGQAVAIRSALELTTSYKARLLRGGFHFRNGSNRSPLLG